MHISARQSELLHRMLCARYVDLMLKVRFSVCGKLSRRNSDASCIEVLSPWPMYLSIFHESHADIGF
jgi:hypothetical protein